MTQATGAQERTPAPGRPRGLRAVWVMVHDALGAAWKHRIFGLAAEAGFWALLSLPPLLLTLLGTLGYVSSSLLTPHTVDSVEHAVLRGARHFVSPDVVDKLSPTVHHVLHNGRSDVISIGFVLSLWSGSTAVATYVNTITIAYDLRDVRSAVRSRLLALGLYLAGVAVGVVMLPMLVLGPSQIVRLFPTSTRGAVATLVHAGYWPVVALASLAVLATLYHLSVPVRTPWHRDLPGALVAMGLWLLGSFLLRVWLSFVLGSATTYASLGTPIAALLFLYVTGLAVLFGAELNAALDRVWPSRATSQARALSSSRP